MREEKQGEFELSWEMMTTSERVATVASIVFFLMGAVVGPYFLCVMTERVPANNASAFILDAIVIELLGMALSVLLPLKAAFKRWLHGKPGDLSPSQKHLRRISAAIWIVGILGLTSLLLPQGFFLLTARPTAHNATQWCIDAAVFLLAIIPQILSLAPWLWAANRITRRAHDEASGGEEMLQA